VSEGLPYVLLKYEGPRGFFVGIFDYNVYTREEEPLDAFSNDNA